MATSENQKATPDKSAAQQTGDKSAADSKAAQQTGDKLETAKRDAASNRSETAAKTASGQSVRDRRTGKRDSDNPGGGVADEMRESYERRVTVPGAGNVDARLDNRRGADRPKLEEWPAKPQQIDGPDVTTQAEFTRAVLDERQRGDENEGRKGMFSPGPHSLGDESLREGDPTGGDETLYGTESLTEGEMPGGGGAPKADG